VGVGVCQFCASGGRRRAESWHSRYPTRPAIVERNYRTRWGELDIVAFDGHVLAFVEVKARRLAPGAGSPFEAIRPQKRARVRKMARSWLLERKQRPYADVMRFDAIGVTFDLAGRLVGIEHLEGAF
jgi:putative endonuclease